MSDQKKWAGNDLWRECVLKPFSTAMSFAKSLGKRTLTPQQAKRARKTKKLRKVQKESRRRNRR